MKSCNVTASRRANLINCGSTLKGTLKNICCPKNNTLDSAFNDYRNDQNCGKHAGVFFDIVGGSDVKPHDFPWTVKKKY